MDIFLVRHGEAAAKWGQDADPGLSSLGEQQAVAVAKMLQTCLDDGVQLVSSPLRRAQETAAPLASALGLTVSINAAFREIPAPAALPDRQSWLRGFMQQDWQEQPRDLVYWRDQALRQLCELTAPTVIFTHFLVLNAIVGSVLEKTETLYYWPDNASITHMKLNKDGALELLKLGDQMDTVVN